MVWLKSCQSFPNQPNWGDEFSTTFIKTPIYETFLRTLDFQLLLKPKPMNGSIASDGKDCGSLQLVV